MATFPGEISAAPSAIDGKNAVHNGEFFSSSQAQNVVYTVYRISGFSVVSGTTETFVSPVITATNPDNGHVLTGLTVTATSQRTALSR